MIRLYLLGYKAYIAFRDFSEDLSYLIESVVVGNDLNLTEDYSKAIFMEAKDRGIRAYSRSDAPSNYTQYAFAIGWRWLIDMNSCRQLIVLHDSLLPKYRGFNPLVTALINGDRQIGVTALIGEKIFDAGDIIQQWSANITYPLTIKKAIQIVSKGYAELLNNVVRLLEKSKILNAYPQDELLVSYSVWRDKDDYLINWEWPAEKIKRFIDAVGEPYSGAQCYVNGQRIKVREAEVYSNNLVANPGFGKVILKVAGAPVVVTGCGLLILKKVSYMDDREFKLPVKLKYKFE